LLSGQFQGISDGEAGTICDLAAPYVQLILLAFPVASSEPRRDEPTETSRWHPSSWRWSCTKSRGEFADGSLQFSGKVGGGQKDGQGPG